MRVCLISTSGGHLSQLEALAPAARGHDMFLVTVPSPHASSILPGTRRYFVRQILRNPVNFLINAFQSARILLRERPDVVITTGAGDALPTVILAATLGVMVLFVESFARARAPSLFGRLAHRWCEAVFFQWAELQKAYPRGKLVAPIFRITPALKTIPDSPSLLVLTGTHSRGFERLLRSLDEQVGDRLRAREVVFQIGHATYVPRKGASFRFLPHDELMSRIEAADLVITHDGAASIGEALSRGKPTVVVPRRLDEKEVSYASGHDLACHLAEAGLIVLVDNPDDIARAVQSLLPQAKLTQLQSGPSPIEVLRECLSRKDGGRTIRVALRGRNAAVKSEIDGMRIVVVTPINPWEPSPSGVRTYTEALIDYLVRARAIVTVVTTGSLPAPRGVRAIFLSERRSSSIRFLVELGLRGPELGRTGDIFHVQRLDHALPLLPWIGSRPMIATLHGNVVQSVEMRRGHILGWFERLAETVASAFIDRFIAVDDGTRKLYETNFPSVQGRIDVIPSGFWAPSPSPIRDGLVSIERVPSDAKVILFAGRFVREKNLELLIDSFAEVTQRVPSAFLFLVGEGPEEKYLKARAAALGVKRFAMIPPIDRRGLLELIRRADVVSITSRFESGPLLAFEAISLGTPVVTTPVGRVEEILHKWDVGVIAPPDRRPFSTALAEVLERGRTYYRQSCEAAARSLSLDASFEKLACVYVSVHASRGV